MRIGVDYSTRPDNWDFFFAKLRSLGYDFIIRYLYDFPDAKRLGHVEIAAALKAGIGIACYFETSEGACLDGYDRGVAHARRAQSEITVLGLPVDTPVIYCIDIDAAASQLRGPCDAYFRGILSQMPLARVHVYGGLKAVEYIRSKNLASAAVQTEAWSRFDNKGRLNGKYPVTWSQYADVHQWTSNGPGVIGGVACDGLDLIGKLKLYPNQEEPEMTEEQDRLLRYNHVRLLGLGLEIGILRAQLKGADDDVLAEMQQNKAEAVAAERKQLGI